MIERNIIGSGEGGEIGMIRNDQGDFDTELTIRLTEEKIVKTMSDFRYHDEHSGFLSGGEHIEDHRVGVRDWLKGIPELVDLNGLFFFREMHAHEESFRGRIAELGRVHYIQIPIDKELGHGMHNAGAVRAGESEDVVRHDVEGDN